ncbi:MAG: TetR/AcrR family transcriptional regulator, partial [Zoogloeaceae bacterium]|nr:TetR/AcrR family transcriptional regulator [Zoogloeaceae bacterium]
MHTAEPKRKGFLPKTQRLKPDERRAALLSAARELSVEQGAIPPSLDAIIKRAGGSRRSVYTAFGCKAGLVNALMSEISTEILSAFSDDIEQNHDLRTTLMRFARNLTTVLASEHGIALSRIILNDCFSSRERAKTFFAQGPGKAMRLLANILENARARGEIEVQDSLASAGCFIAMSRSFYLERVMQLRPPPGEEEIEIHVKAVVDTFLNGLRPRER